MLLDQAYRLRQIVRGSRGQDVDCTNVLPLVVVSGGKGGVGTSTVALQLATASSRLGRRVVLVEADLDHGGKIEQACDGGSIADCIAGRSSVRDVLEPGPEGIWTLPGAWAPQDLVECTATVQDRLLSELRSLTAHADLLIADVGSSRNHFVRRFWRAASMVVMVTTPEMTSVMDTYAAIKVLLAGDTSIPVYTLINFATNGSNSILVHERIRATCKRFLGLRTSVLGAVPTRALPDSSPPSTRVTKSVFDPLARTLCEELGLGTPNQNTLRLAA
jgi:flagellar biosynthesis protein FlhG